MNKAILKAVGQWRKQALFLLNATETPETLETTEEQRRLAWRFLKQWGL